MSGTTLAFLIVLLALSIPILAILVDSQLGKALASRIESGRTPLDAELQARLVALETELERVAGELEATETRLERVVEANEFMTRLLTQSSGGSTTASDETDA